jgi:hypothetical protein
MSEDVDVESSGVAPAPILGPIMDSLSSGFMSMAEDIDMAVSGAFVPELTVRQSECAWCNQHDRSQIEAEAEVETMRTDSNAANEPVILRIA